MTFYLPLTGEWAIAVNGQDEDILRRLEVAKTLHGGCPDVNFQLDADGGLATALAAE